MSGIENKNPNNDLKGKKRHRKASTASNQSEHLKSKDQTTYKVVLEPTVNLKNVDLKKPDSKPAANKKRPARTEKLEKSSQVEEEKQEKNESKTSSSKMTKRHVSQNESEVIDQSKSNARLRGGDEKKGSNESKKLAPDSMPLREKKSNKIAETSSSSLPIRRKSNRATKSVKYFPSPKKRRQTSAEGDQEMNSE